MKQLAMTIYNNHDGFNIITNGNEYGMVFVPFEDHMEYVGDFIFAGKEEDTIVNNVRCGAPVTFEDRLFYFKRQYCITKENTLPAFESHPAGKILDIKFESGADISVTLPEDSHYTYFNGTNSCYIFKDEDIPDNMKDTKIGDLANAIYSSKSGRYKLLVDYTSNEAFVLDRMDNVISNSSFNRNIYDIVSAMYKDYGKINYIYDDTEKKILFDIKKDYEDSDLFCIRVDMEDDNDITDKIIALYPISYLVTLDDLYVFTEDTKIYCSLEYNLNDKGNLELSSESYCVLDSEGERNLYVEWMNMLEKLSE